MTKRAQAELWNAEGIELKEQGDLEGAAQKYRQAIDCDPTWGIPLYNLGLVHKVRREWAESLAYNERAMHLQRDDPATCWNLGIAATALGRWDVARRAWRSFGITIPDGDGPIDLPCGLCPIRLNPQGAAEVVWAYRIDPARAVLSSVPLPESEHRWNDIVLNDGAPTGHRMYNGKEVPVFDAIQLLQPSAFGTYVARVLVPDENSAVQALIEIASKSGGCAEDWSTSIRMLCRACSEGRPHQQHDTANGPPLGTRTIGIAAKSREHAESILHTWESNAHDASVEWLDDALLPK